VTDTARLNRQKALDRQRAQAAISDDAAVVSAVDAVARLRARQTARNASATFRVSREQFDELLEANRQLAEILSRATPLPPEDPDGHDQPE
jgi:hypothetical protein